MLEDNLKKWASTCGLNSEDIIQQLAHAQPLSPRQLIKKSSPADEDVTDDEEVTFKKGSPSSQRPRALISDDQVVTLKAYYGLNSKPRREELIKISEEIGKKRYFLRIGKWGSIHSRLEWLYKSCTTIKRTTNYAKLFC